MKQPLNGKVAVVTGGSSGIGLSIARRLIKDDADVVITGRDVEKLHQAVQILGDKAHGIVADVSRSTSLNAFYQQIETTRGHIDILVANAGGGIHAPLGQITESQIDEQFATNV